MSLKADKLLIEKLLQYAKVTLNGDQPWDLQVHQDQFYARILRDGPLGLGEAYMDGWWDCERLDTFFERVLRAGLENKVMHNLRLIIRIFLAKIFNFQSKSRAFHVGEKHYNLDKNLFQTMLDSRMIYSCGYWRNASSLEEAQVAKLELACQKLKLETGMRLLDIGCGWGGFAKFAAEKYGVSVVGLTVSSQQAEYAKEICKDLPIEIRCQDYRELNEKFDRIVSIGMFEHVGHRNYPCYMEVARRCLGDDGIFLLHTIGNNVTTVAGNEWITKYIFPNSMIPSITQLGHALEERFIMEDWHNFGADYDKTLIAWHHNFIQHWPLLQSQFDQRFFRTWTYYLLSAAGAFRARDLQLWQIVLSKKGLFGGYQAPR